MSRTRERFDKREYNTVYDRQVSRLASHVTVLPSQPDKHNAPAAGNLCTEQTDEDRTTAQKKRQTRDVYEREQPQQTLLPEP